MKSAKKLVMIETKGLKIISRFQEITECLIFNCL